ncbi:Pls/PosA family non-ribosomal peptide synthetase [Nostoc punctiforme]|uniref:Non-ribosomal peptide synthetase n=1 Tax=Nostoc punctiforme (strain ATCC 29133 / PCC 73102) TaxID=63737 RepID=B2IYU7_NOSP7|nr:Pls/PosA family non-ribosomal peptide synthetase [Nostoc punctiforme]ACC81680.1 non-ribosomal peptide synthetase [Nostoc punctiforme PCC 73102]
MDTKYRWSNTQNNTKIVNSINAKFDEFGSKQIPQRLHYFFENRCDIDANALAIVCETESLSYAELDARANQLANYFVHKGISQGDRVGILLERSVNTYITLLAILKSGAAFVPLDSSFPQDRIAFIAENASLNLLVSSTKLSELTVGVSCLVLMLDTVATDVAAQAKTRIELSDLEDELCYIIYTSGSTGRPKGVAVNHSNICSFITICTPIYGVKSWDRVYQGIIIAFDFSFEEIWPTLAVGATIIVGPTDHRKIGLDLADFLIEQKVTMLYCVPTLLATVDKDIPAIHTLIVGGEACSQDLVKRWSHSGRRMLNTYGPTETTITALWTELVPDKAVTIGKPLPDYSVYILDEHLQEVPLGEIGEICIGGIGVTQGYVNLPEQTASKFVTNPFEQSHKGEKIYRSGDLGRVTPDGEIEFLGRIDHQVKIRGYRLELTEIEAILLENQEIENAIVSLVSINDAVKELAAYITLHIPVTDPEALKYSLYTSLSSRLPSYMVPAFIDILDAIPTLPNGKADRSKLPTPITTRLKQNSGNYVPPATELEQELANTWGHIFGNNNISVEEDFFEDLGGHSLFAARTISNLRLNPILQSLSIADLYSHTTIRALANHIKGIQQQQSKPISQIYTKSHRTLRHHSNLRVWFYGGIQTLLLYLLFAILGVPLILVLANTHSWSSPLQICTRAILVSASWLLITLMLPIIAKWLLIGRFRPGRYPLWGWYYCRWWLVRKIIELAPLNYLAGSPLMPFYMRLLGARIGKGCHIGTKDLHLPDLIAIADEVSIGYSVQIQPFIIEDGWLYQSPIQIGANTFIDTNSVVMLGSSVGQGVQLAEQSLVAEDQTIPDYQTWAGSPSARTSDVDPIVTEISDRKTPSLKWSPVLWLGFVAGLVLLETLPLMIFTPGLVFEYFVSQGELLKELVYTPIAGLLYTLTACTLVALGKWLVMPTTRPGIFPEQSGFGLRKWLADKLIFTSLAVTNTLYATLYTAPWLRLLGAKIGPRSEVSTVSHIDPNLLTVGAESFVADFATIGPAKYYNGFISLGATKLGSRCFVGNAALVPGNTHLGDNSLIGVQSVPPTQPVKSGTSWLGSPAIFLPRRQQNECFDENVTFRPSMWLVAGRLAIEFVRIVLPPTLIYVLFIQNLLGTTWLMSVVSIPMQIALWPVIYLTSSLLLTILVAILKWITVGRYRPRVEPLWSNFVRRTELITGLYETVAVPFLLKWFTGTPLLAPLLRLFGAKIGRRVYMETTFLTEFDLVRVADDAAIANLTSLQTHLFEDRVMKMSKLRIGRGCSVGTRSVVLYDSEMEAGAKLDALSLVMKGEMLPFKSHWQGIPSRSVD